MEPSISVGVVSHPKVHFALYGSYNLVNSSTVLNGSFTAEIHSNQVRIHGSGFSEVFPSGVELTPRSFYDEHFNLRDVVIGVGFHWERKEKQDFRGNLRLIIEGDKITAINVVPVEEYLTSVISSEMNARSGMELLKAHSVISRSWLLAQLDRAKAAKNGTLYRGNPINTDDEIVKWYDREDHAHFDFCADDHCQRYQGITKIFSENAMSAVKATRGIVLQYDDEVCDARFYKCCGGITESYENVWEDKHYNYLLPVFDYRYAPDEYASSFEVEKDAQKWIRSNPPAFCNTNDKKVLAQILPDFDQETTDFYRWKVVYSQEKIRSLIERRLTHTLGDIIDLVPIQRGPSSRLIKLKIVGSEKSITIGKELEIRKLLSDSHLYSSAFVIDKADVVNGVPQQFTLFGAGWGHGVGLCQIGAAVMAERGYQFDNILSHYYPNAELKKIY